MVAGSPRQPVVGLPWSSAAGMKWVPIRPLVIMPQIAKLPPIFRARVVEALSYDGPHV